MYGFTDDPGADQMRYDAEMERRREEWEESRPVCNRCGNHIIDDEAVEIDGDYYCLDCIEEMTIRF